MNKWRTIAFNRLHTLIYVVIRYCEAENTSATSGITYSWPRTLAGESVALICPTESNVLVTRNCSMEGLWQTMADDECDSVSEQLDMLNPSFTNVSIIDPRQCTKRRWRVTVIVWRFLED